MKWTDEKLLEILKRHAEEIPERVLDYDEFDIFFHFKDFVVGFYKRNHVWNQYKWFYGDHNRRQRLTLIGLLRVSETLRKIANTEQAKAELKRKLKTKTVRTKEKSVRKV